MCTFHISEKLQQGLPANTILTWILHLWEAQWVLITKKVNAFLGAKEIHNNFPETNTICIANSHSGGKDEDVLLYSLYLKIMMPLTVIITVVMIITKYSLPTVDFATRYSTWYSDFLLQPYSNPTRSKKRLLVGAWLSPIIPSHHLSHYMPFPHLTHHYTVT